MPKEKNLRNRLDALLFQISAKGESPTELMQELKTQIRSRLEISANRLTKILENSTQPTASERFHLAHILREYDLAISESDLLEGEKSGSG